MSFPLRAISLRSFSRPRRRSPGAPRPRSRVRVHYRRCVSAVRASHYVPYITFTLTEASASRRRTTDGRDLGRVARYLLLTKTWKSIWVSRARAHGTRNVACPRPTLESLSVLCAFALLFFSFCLPLSHTLPSTSHSLFDGWALPSCVRRYIYIYIRIIASRMRRAKSAR